MMYRFCAISLYLADFLHTAKAGTQTTCHQILKRHLTGYILFLSIVSHRLHHRRGTATLNHVKLLLLQNRMLCDETTFTG